MFQITTFNSDVTPPLGHPLCAGWYPPATAIRDPLSALGIILVPDDQQPVVLCALDWSDLYRETNTFERHYVLDWTRYSEDVSGIRQTEPGFAV